MITVAASKLIDATPRYGGVQKVMVSYWAVTVRMILCCDDTLLPKTMWGGRKAARLLRLQI